MRCAMKNLDSDVKSIREKQRREWHRMDQMLAVFRSDLESLNAAVAVLIKKINETKGSLEANKLEFKK